MDMTTERPTAVHALHDGDACFYQAPNRLPAPCKVIGAWADGDVEIEFTATVGPYERGERCDVSPSLLHHPDAIHGHHFAGGPRILGRTVYMGAR